MREARHPMLAALLYLQFHSIKNRTLMRFKRLKQPKYLVGAIVGGVYFYFYFFRYIFGFPGRPAQLPVASNPNTAAFYESLGALILFTILLLAWIIPHQRAALAFTEAEVAFLFPAPVTRRGLIHFKLLRSQTAILFTTLLLTVVANRFGGRAWIHAAGWWLILSTLNLHFLGSSFARTLLLERGISTWRRRTAILMLLLVVVAVVVVWARRALPPFDASQFEGLDNSEQFMVRLQNYAKQLLVAGPIPYLLFPFRLVVRPYLAPSAAAFVLALGPALLVLAVHYWWVARSDVAFEEASVEASKRIAEKVAAIRSGDWQASRKPRKAKRAPFRLRPLGPPSIALLWKNLISAGSAFSLRTWIMLAILSVAGSIALQNTAGGSISLMVMGMSAMFMIWSCLMGPQFVRQDLRQDLLLTDVLKIYPMPGWQIVLGEVMAPAVILTAIQWVLLLIALALFFQIPAFSLSKAVVLELAFGAALILPLINLLNIQIPNAAALLFPGWFQVGREGPHGIEATGQRLVFLLGQFVVILLALIPAALAFAAIYFGCKLAGVIWLLALPPSLIAAALVLAAEAFFGLLLLGRLFDRFDLSKELAP
jgi:hypothetical protein